MAVGFYDPDTVAYPVLNSNDHEHRFEYYQTRDANLTVTISDASGDIVRTVHDRESETSTRGSYIVWDLADQTGTPVPDGIYTIDMTAVDSGGHVDHDSVRAGVDRRARPPLGGITPDSVVSGTIQPFLLAPDDLPVSEVYFTMSPTRCPSAKGMLTGGVYTGALDVATCPHGTAWLSARMHWIDPLGDGAYGFSTSIRVTAADHAAPVIASFPEIKQTLVNSRTYRVDQRRVQVAESSHIQEAGIRVADSTGRTVRSERPLEPSGELSDYSLTISWDGKDDAGRPQPTGRYTVHLRVVDAAGNVGTTTGTVLLDHRIPGTLSVTPVAGAPNRYDVRVTTAPGIVIENVTAWGAGRLVRDGQVWSGSINVSDRQAGPLAFNATVTWRTPDESMRGGFVTDDIWVTVIDERAPVVDISSDDLDYAQYRVGPERYTGSGVMYNVSDTTGLSSCRYWISDSAGRPVVSERPLQKCAVGSQWFSWDGRDGDGVLQPTGIYTVHARFVDPLGHATLADVVTVRLDGRIPGTVTAAPDADDPDVFHLTVTPVPGTVVTKVTGPRSALGRQDPDTGLWHVRVDLSDRADLTSISATIEWSSPDGYVPYETAPVPIERVDVKPPVVTPVHRPTSYLRTPEAYDINYPAFHVREPYGLAEASYRITASDGTVVVPRRPFDETSGSPLAVYWDGRLGSGELAPAGRYTIDARFADHAGNVTTSTTTMTLDRLVPVTLIGPTGDVPLTGRVQFEVTPNLPPGAILDLAYVKFDSSRSGPWFNNPSVDGIWRSTYDVDQLPPGPATYVLNARWLDSTGLDHFYMSEPFQLDIAARAAPEPPIIETDVGESSIRLQWRVGQPNLTGFRVEWSPDTAGAPWSGIDLPATAREHLITGLPAGARYQVRIQSISAAGPSAWATALLRTWGASQQPIPGDHLPDPHSALAPPGPVAARATARKRAAKISWHPADVVAESGPPTSYSVQIRRPGGRWKTVVTLTVDRTSLKIRSLRPGVVHRIRVIARNDAGKAVSAVLKVRPRR